MTHLSTNERIVSLYGNLITQYQKRILALECGIFFLAAIGILFLKVEVDFTKFFKPGTEIRDSMDFMNREMTGVMDIDIRIEGDMKSPKVLNKVQKIQTFIDSRPSVHSTFSIVDVIKQMHRTIMDDDPQFESIPESREKVNNLFTLYLSLIHI